MRLRRYWLQFEGQLDDGLPPGVLRGCGVTAWSYDDAINLIQERIFLGEAMPPVTSCIEDVDISTLDEGHVLPNMAIPIPRGIWFPRGYEE